MQKKEMGRIRNIAQKILALEPVISAMTDDQLSSQTFLLRKKIAAGVDKMQILIESFATAREAAKRKIGLHPFPVQIEGAILLSEGSITEMKTGEGKTLVAILPVYFNFLYGINTHIVTVNEYLAERDANWNKPVYEFLGLKVGFILAVMTREQKIDNYNSDVVYVTNSEVAFDYLRDNMILDNGDKTQVRGLDFAIVDEADSVLIDEARTPLIISDEERKQWEVESYKSVDTFVKSLVKDDYTVAQEEKQIYFNPTGIEKAERHFGFENLFSPGSSETFHLLQNSLRANYVLKDDVDYIVEREEQGKRKIILIDQFTGRKMENRSFSDGLQQAIQAKENVPIELENVIVATITYQNFFRLYKELSGMTGTAKTEEKEFYDIYRTRVFEISTNKPMIRRDEDDYVFADKRAKHVSLAKEVEKRHKKGQPILIGTVSVESSEEIAEFLEQLGLYKFEVLNAKDHEREAEIIKKAGRMKAITVATNMAGRGTDIVLEKGVKQLGGLAVLGVERNESRRIDNQLRGRAGRQGDPGFSRFYVSMEDELVVRFGANVLRTILKKVMDPSVPLTSKSLSRSITRMQEKVEAVNFDVRKNLLEYDNVLSQHRQYIYKLRNKVLTVDTAEEMWKLVKTIFEQSIWNHLQSKKKLDFKIKGDFSFEKAAQQVTNYVLSLYLNARRVIPDKDVIVRLERSVILKAIDQFWTLHINNLSQLRSFIHLRSYAQYNPVHSYVEEAAVIFQDTERKIADQVSQTLFNFATSPYQVRDHRRVSNISVSQPRISAWKG